MDPVLRLHCDPDRKITGLVLSRGGNPAITNASGLTPDEGLAAMPADAAEERALLAREGLAMPPATVARTHARHQEVLSDARAALRAATPHPNLAAYAIKPAVLPPWERPEAHPLDKGMLERKSSLQAAREAARQASARAGGAL